MCIDRLKRCPDIGGVPLDDDGDDDDDEMTTRQSIKGHSFFLLHRIRIDSEMIFSNLCRFYVIHIVGYQIVEPVLGD